MSSRYLIGLFCVAASATDLLAQGGMQGMPGGAGGRPPSRIEMFIARPNIVAQSEYFPISTFGELEIDTMRMTDLNSDQSMTLLQVMYNHNGVSKSVILEQEEVDILVRGINVFVNKALHSTPKQHTVVDVATRSGTAFQALWEPVAGGTGKWKTSLLLLTGGEIVPVAMDPNSLLEFAKQLDKVRPENHNLPAERH